MYKFVVIDPALLKVAVRMGDEVMPEGMVGYIQGSVLRSGGSMRRAWLAIGYSIVFGSELFNFFGK